MRAIRRRQIRRRRFIALAVAFILVPLAVALAYALPSQAPARVPGIGAASPFGSPQGVPQRVVVATVSGVDVLLPVDQAATTAIAYHPVDNANAVAFSPAGQRANAGGLARSLADVFRGGGGVSYYLMGGDGASASTAGLDVGGVPGVDVYSPVDGQVTGVKHYQLLGRYPDVEVDIRLAGDPSLLLVVTHLSDPAVKAGDRLRAGETPLGALRRFDAQVDQDLSQFTTDAGDHVDLAVLRVPPELAGF